MKSSEMDMTQGPILSKLLTYSLPLIASSMLQLLFNAVDMIVVGQFTGKEALAAVGSTSSLIAMMTTLFIGISLGVNVCTAHAFAQHDDRVVSNSVHTAMLSAVIFGVFTLIIGVVFGRTFLELMGNPDDVIDLATLYIKIYFLGMPFFMLYNFGAAILKAIGDTKKPLIYLTVAGVLNAGLNIFLVLVFNMGVAGVAIATVFSQLVSAVLVIRTLLKADTSYKLIPKKLRIDGYAFKKMIKIGIPAGLQSMLVNASNVLIQSNINSFGSTVMASYSTMNSLRNFCYVGVNSITQAAMSFVGQNYGVKNFKRIDKITKTCFTLALVIGGVLGALVCIFSRELTSLYSSDPNVIETNAVIMPYAVLIYGFAGTMDVMPGCMRGINVSFLPMMIHIMGIVVFRFVWILGVFPHFGTIENLLISYPVSWIITTAGQVVAYIYAFRKAKKPYLNRADAVL